MSRNQQRLKQIIRLARACAEELPAEDHQAAVEIKLAAECLLASRQNVEGKIKPARAQGTAIPHHD